MDVSRIFGHWWSWLFAPNLRVRKKYEAFKELMLRDKNALELIASLEEIHFRQKATEYARIKHLYRCLAREIEGLLDALLCLKPNCERSVFRIFRRLDSRIKENFFQSISPPSVPFVQFYDSVLHERFAGGKGAQLSRMLAELRLPVPDGFVITTSASRYFLQKSGLLSPIEDLLGRLELEDQTGLELLSQEIQDLILHAPLPGKLVKSVENALSDSGLSRAPLALRSSAVGEDGRLSFAGQFRSELGVTTESWAASYRRIVASKYSPSALCYRIRAGLTDEQVAMAVLIMETVTAALSGIMYTRCRDTDSWMCIYAVRGYGSSLVQGHGCQASIRVSAAGREIRHQECGIEVPKDVIWKLAVLGRKLQAFFGCPQDMEWCVDGQGRLFVLQSRPLQLGPAPEFGERRPPIVPALLRGEWASSGRTAGPVFWLRPGAALSDVPSNVILVVEHLTPDLVQTLDRIAGVIAHKGSPACHFASLAREASLPVLVESAGAKGLNDGEQISMDADTGLVYPGSLFCATEHRPAQRQTIRNWTLHNLERIIGLIATLHLSHPGTTCLKARKCRSLHDIVLYAHETGVREMFNLVGKRGLNRFGVKRLLTTLPLVAHVLDVGGGLAGAALTGRTVGPEHFRSRPLLALWEGLSHPAASWNASILHYDWEGYGRYGDILSGVEKSVLLGSYIVAAQEYVHAQLRFGYHFAVVDALCGNSAEQNYIHCSFKGGGGNFEQRLLRVEIIKEILCRYQFGCKKTGDFLKAEFTRRGRAETEDRIRLLGYVLARTVLLDFHLSTSQSAQEMSAAMLQDFAQ